MPRKRLAQTVVSRGGWYFGPALSDAQRDDAERRWIDRSYAHRADQELQCGGCAFFAATGMDFGICANADSPLDGAITFEHGGCVAHAVLALLDADATADHADQDG